VRSVPGRRHHPHRDALSAGRLRHLRAVQRQTVQPRNAGRSLQGENDHRRAGDDSGGSARFLPPRPVDKKQATDHLRRRAGLHKTGTARHDAFRRGGAESKTFARTVQAGHRQYGLHPRRTDNRTAFRRYTETAERA